MTYNELEYYRRQINDRENAYDYLVEATIPVQDNQPADSMELSDNIEVAVE